MIVKNRKVILFVSIVFLIGIILFNTPKVSNKASCEEPLFSKPILVESEIQDNLTLHAPIYINSNDDFETLGFSGNGTVNFPYIIEKLNITSTVSNTGIKITGTTVYFVIDPCLVLSEYIGIHLDHVGAGTGKVINNICISSSGDGGGIGISESNGCNITSNECFNFMQGIHLNFALSTIIFGNLILANNYQGINIRYSNINTITYNSIRNSEQHGLALVGSSHSNVIHHNEFINNSKVEQYTIDGERSGTIESQGYDEGNNNIWYDESEKVGNSWSDYSGRGDYAIDGSAEAVDHYPMHISSTDTSSISISIVIVTIVFTNGLYQLIQTKRKKEN